jgi:hypothetical protein
MAAQVYGGGFHRLRFDLRHSQPNGEKLMLKGSCNFNGVIFPVKDVGQSVSACHCTQCGKQSGPHWVSGYTDVNDFEISGDVSWFETSITAKRGFCPTCGCFLFWKANTEDGMSFSLGVIDGPTGLKLQKHIFVADKGDYYTIADDVPQREQ